MEYDSSVEVDTKHLATGQDMATAKGKWKLLSYIFKVIKKIDYDEMITAAARTFTPQKYLDLINAAVMGSVCSLVLLLEGYHAFREMLAAIKDAKTAQRKTRLIMDALIIGAAGSGIGMAVASIVGLAGVAISGFALMPFLIPAMITAIYGFVLWKESYALTMAKQNASKAKQSLQATVAEITSIRAAISTIQQELNNLQPNVDKQADNPTLSSQECQLSAAYQEKSAKLKALQDQLHNLELERTTQESVLMTAEREKLSAEREVAFSALEVAGSLISLTATLLTVSAIVGAGTVASMGILPLVLLGVGVGFGVAVSLFDIVDEHHEFKFTKAIRTACVSGWNHLFGISKAPEKLLSREVPVDQPISATAESTSIINKTLGVTQSTLHETALKQATETLDQQQKSSYQWQPSAVSPDYGQHEADDFQEKPVIAVGAYN